MKIIRRNPTVPRKSGRRDGVAAVEFALITPLLFLLLFMMIEASRYLMGLHAVTGAAREANRIFAIQRDESRARDAAIEFMRQSSFDVTDLRVRFTESAATIPNFDVFTCEVEIDYADISLINDPFNLGVSGVSGFSAMLIEEN